MNHIFTSPLEKITISNTGETLASLTEDIIAGRIRRIHDGTNSAEGRQIALLDMGDGVFQIAESAEGDHDADGVITVDDATLSHGTSITIYPGAGGTVVRKE